MRVTCTLIALFAAAAASGCAQDPHAYAPGGGDAMTTGQASGPVNRGLFTGSLSSGQTSGRPLFASVAPPPSTQPLQNDPPPLRYGSAMPAAAPASYGPPAQEGAVESYTLDSGDRLRVVVFGQDGLTNSYIVDASGHIAMPLIGSVPARGATSEGLAGRIAERLRHGYIREPHVAVEIEAYRPFFILGEVGSPGQYPYVANMTVETAVAIAGGFGPRGYRDEVTITRSAGGRLYRFAVPVTYPVRPGDTVTVRERWF